MINVPSGLSLVLASESPRRRRLLASAGLHVEVRPADIDETVLPGEPPTDYVRRLASEKGLAVMRPAEIVVAADTTVDVDGEILAKPLDDHDVARMLALLSGRSHEVHTGVMVAGPRSDTVMVVTTRVTFADLTPDMIDWYVGTGDGLGKAGGYGVQGAAGAFVTRLEGSVTNVIGLPLAETLDLLRLAVAGGGC